MALSTTIANPPLMNYGYKGEIILPIQIQAPDYLSSNVNNKSISFLATFQLLVCREICIPESAELKLTLPVHTKNYAPSTQNSWRAAIVKARRQLPITPTWPLAVSQEKDTIAIDIPATVHQAHFFPLNEGITPYAAEQSILHHRLIVPRGRYAHTPLTSLEGVLVLKERGNHAEKQLTHAFAINTPLLQPTALPQITLWQAICFALIGGLLLNLMPCVFPMISIKILSFMQISSGSKKQLQQHGWFFTGGILVCFTMIATVMNILRASGEQIGWGYQLQSPLIVALLAYLMLLVGLLFSGVVTFGNALMGVGNQLATDSSKTGLSSSFLTGMLAVIVATPCTVPFMATAMGFAAVQPLLISLAIFLSLGLGMALPYLLLCYCPQWLQRLPKQGPWLEHLKKILALPMYATALWLLWVLSQQVNINHTLMVMLGMALIITASIFYHLAQKFIYPTTNTSAALALVILSATLLPSNTEHFVKTIESDTLKNWQIYSPEKLRALRKAGTPVFLNVTAAWCITCQVNDRLALSRPSVQDLFKQKGGVFMKADWTNRDPEVSQLLSQFNRIGVPLYVLYPAHSSNREPYLLPQILTEDLLLSEFEKLKILSVKPSRQEK